MKQKLATTATTATNVFARKQNELISFDCFAIKPGVITKQIQPNVDHPEQRMDFSHRRPRKSCTLMQRHSRSNNAYLSHAK